MLRRKSQRSRLQRSRRDVVEGMRGDEARGWSGAARRGFAPVTATRTTIDFAAARGERSERGRARDRGMRREKLLATWRRRTRVAYPLRRPTTIVAIRGAFATDCTTRPNLPDLCRTTGGLERPARAFRLSPPSPPHYYYDVRSNATSTYKLTYSRRPSKRKAGHLNQIQICFDINLH